MVKMTYKGLRSYLIESRKKRTKWKDIGKSFPGVPLGTLCRIVKDADYEPKSPALRARLGLCREPVTVTPCSVCGSTRHKHHRERRPDRVIRLKRLRELLQSPYMMS